MRSNFECSDYHASYPRIKTRSSFSQINLYRSKASTKISMGEIELLLTENYEVEYRTNSKKLTPIEIYGTIGCFVMQGTTTFFLNRFFHRKLELFNYYVGRTKENC